MRLTISPLMFINLMKKAFSKLRQCLQCFWEYIKHIDKILLIFVFFLGTFVALAVAVAVEVPENIVNCLQELLGLSEKDEVLKFIGFCIAGVVSIWLALSADKRANAMDATAKNTKEEQRQERLKNAIEHLGHDKDSVRMGGAYELFHLAKDIEGLRRTVMDILCAHIRQTTTGQTARGKDYRVEHKTKPSEEIQSLLTLLFVQKHNVFESCSINLQGSYLNGATLRQARLKKANLIGAQLQDADLWEAQLQGADLGEAQLEGATLWEAQLQGADLRGTRLQEADLSKAQLQKANLMGAQLQGAALMETRLQGATLLGTRMQGTDLREAQMQGATLLGTRMQGTDLREAQMQGADLMNVQLQGANLYKAQLQETNLRAAQLQGVSSHEAHPPPPANFGRKIKKQIGKDSDLTGIIFSGGLELKDLDTLCEGLSAEKAQALREKLTPHIGLKASNELPENSGAKTGAYTQEKAEQWVAEYNKTMEEASSADDTANAASAPDSDKNKED